MKEDIPVFLVHERGFPFRKYANDDSNFAFVTKHVESIEFNPLDVGSNTTFTARVIERQYHRRRNYRWSVLKQLSGGQMMRVNKQFEEEVAENTLAGIKGAHDDFSNKRGSPDDMI